MSYVTISNGLILREIKSPKERKGDRKCMWRNNVLKVSKINENEKYKPTDPKNSMDSSRRNMENTTQRHIVIKLLQTNDNKWNPSSSQRKKMYYVKEKKRMTSNFLSANKKTVGHVLNDWVRNPKIHSSIKVIKTLANNNSQKRSKLTFWEFYTSAKYLKQSEEHPFKKNARILVRMSFVAFFFFPYSCPSLPSSIVPMKTSSLSGIKEENGLGALLKATFLKNCHP